MRFRTLPLLLLVATLVLLAGCSEDDSNALLDGGHDDPCLNCHGDQDLLISMLPEQEAAAAARGDG